ncbi:Zn-dependent hydrolase [Oceanobacillus kimchii]|uniref:Zn-dependent hydrolase n=1 Tax=Oceanobacillus kimchii TaxID=746691 RepID=UPI000986E082|nr:Zn-dependent hydrolase [Oceanobacillus kimchii]MCT1577141.1 Zn-dependent hydrolase [Oceanobacillus kimchii]MCT2135211.1 Zn-dependent hydrolase [Oceanobacillus kimchii]
MNNLQARIEEQIDNISKFTATPDQGTTRLTYSKEDKQAREYIKNKMLEYGLQVREDGFGNIFGKLEGTIKDAPSILIGSHFDSVPNGGSFDGPAGVVAGLEVVALFNENNLKPKYPLEVIALIEEEGSRFGGGLMGSRAMTGLLSEEDFKNFIDHNGVSTLEAMKEIGLDSSLSKKRDPETIKAYLELHIEQGPILEAKKIPIGVVETIVGLTQFEITVDGRAGHAGTTPMDHRSDALVTAAQIIAEIPSLAKEEGEGTVATTGKLNVFPNGSNVIPSKTVFTVDIRSGKEKHIQNVIRKLNQLVNFHNKEGIKITVSQQLYMEPKAMNRDIISLLKKSSSTLDIPYCSINSGAGHDAMVLAEVTDVGMLFVPSKGGVSHTPEEWSDSLDIAKAVEILFETVKKLTEVEEYD